MAWLQASIAGSCFHGEGRRPGDGRRAWARCEPPPNRNRARRLYAIPHQFQIPTAFCAKLNIHDSIVPAFPLKFTWRPRLPPITKSLTKTPLGGEHTALMTTRPSGASDLQDSIPNHRKTGKDTKRRDPNSTTYTVPTQQLPPSRDDAPHRNV